MYFVNSLRRLKYEQIAVSRERQGNFVERENAVDYIIKTNLIYVCTQTIRVRNFKV